MMRFGSYLEIKLSRLEDSLTYDRQQHARRHYFAKEIINSAPELKSCDVHSQSLTNNVGACQEEEKHEESTLRGQLSRQSTKKKLKWGFPKKRDLKQNEKAAGCQSCGSLINLVSDEEEVQTFDYAFAFHCKIVLKIKRKLNFQYRREPELTASEL